MINIGVGVSQREDLIEAVVEAAKEAKERVEEPKLLIVFFTFNYPAEKYQEALKKIKGIFPKETSLVGGSCSGFFAKDRAFDAWSTQGKVRGVGILALDSEYLNVGIGIGEGTDKNPKEAGRKAILEALDSLEYNPSVAYLAMMKKGVKDVIKIRPVNGFLLAPGLTLKHNFIDQAILEGIASVAKRAIRLAGGGTSYGFAQTGRFSNSYQFLNENVYEESVICCLFGSDLEIGYGTATGFKALGPGVFVTKCGDGLIQEFNGRPAAEVLGEMLEKYAEIDKEEFFKNPLAAMAQKGVALGLPEATGDFYWPQVPMQVIEKKYLLSCMSSRVGMGYSLVKVDKKDCQMATVEAAKMLGEDAGAQNFDLVLFFSCALRGFILGEDYSKEIEKIKEVMGEKTEVFGLASVGEQAFYKQGPLMGTDYTITMMGISNRLVSEIVD